MTLRGANIRDMKRRSMAAAATPTTFEREQTSYAEMRARKKRHRQDGHARPEGTEDEVVELLEDGIIADQGDGVHVVQPSRGERRSVDANDESDRDCPDEAPPGWGES